MPEDTNSVIPSTTPIQVASSTSKHILCLEDEQFIGELYARAIKKAGHQIDVIADGEEGLAAAMTDQYDVILLDIMIPRLLGVDILHKLRADKPNLKAKIIISTNLEQDGATRGAIEREADGYLIKAEITPKQLVEYIEQL